MGYVVHKAIVVTSWSTTLIVEAHKKAAEFGCPVTPISESQINGYQSFLVVSNGSKYGWAEDKAGEKNRDDFVNWLNEQKNEDGSTSLEWVQVHYGSDDREASIARHAWSK